MTIFMLAFASRQPFWPDELYSIGVVHGNNDVISLCKQALDDVHPPLFHLVLSLFYRVMPYGEAYLLLLPILFVIGGILALSKVGKAIGGEDLGFFALCVAVTSSILIRHGGWELRAYAMVFCFSSMALLYYVKRLQEETNRHIVFYGISLALLLYSHYFGAILALFYGLMDLCFYLRKKIAFKCIFSYLLAGSLFAPWFILLLLHHTRDLGSFWANPPSWITPVLLVAYLLNESIIYSLFFGIGFLTILFTDVRKLKGKQDTAALSRCCLLSGVLWMLTTVFCYSKFINPKGGMFIPRYFFVVLPHIFLITAYSAIVMCKALKEKSAFVRVAFRCFLLLLLLTIGAQNYYLLTIHPRDPYRELAEYLAKDEKAQSPASLTVIASHETALQGWLAYYFDKRGYDIPPNIAYLPREEINQGLYPVPPLSIFQKDNQKGDRLLTVERLLEYSRLYLYNTHTALSNEWHDIIEQNYVLEETLFQFSLPSSKFAQARLRWIAALKKVLLGTDASSSSDSRNKLKIYSKRQP